MEIIAMPWILTNWCLCHPWVQDAALEGGPPAASAEAPAGPQGTVVPGDGGEDPEKKAKKVAPSHTPTFLVVSLCGMPEQNTHVAFMADPPMGPSGVVNTASSVALTQSEMQA